MPLRVARTLTNVFVAFDFIDKYSRVLSAVSAVMAFSNKIG